MNENDASTTVIDNSRVMLQIVISLTNDSKFIIYDCNMFIVQATGETKLGPSNSASRFLRGQLE